MLKTLTKLEHKVGDRIYYFFCENDSPLGECHDALVKFKDFVIQKIQEVNESQKPREEKKEEAKG